MLSFCLFAGDGSDIADLQQKAGNGDIDAQWKLARCYSKGTGVAKDDRKAFEWFMKVAEKEDVYGQCTIGLMYWEGIGVEKDDKKAFEWFSRAAEQGHVEALFYLGACHERGIGASQDERMAFQFYRKAAELGHARAQYNIGMSYQNGRGVEKDYVKAVEWLRKSAEKGTDRAQRELGLCYGKGKGVAVDRQKAFEWFEKAAGQGDEDALIQMACYHFGAAGFETNSAKAMSCLETAAEKGSVLARLYSACAYFNGYCILVDECDDSIVVGMASADTDKSIRYARMGIGAQMREIRYISALLLMAGYCKKGDLKEALGTAREFPAIFLMTVLGYSALMSGFVLLMAILFWIYAKSRMGHGEGGPWCLFDFFSLFLLLAPFAFVSQAVLLLPLHFLTNGIIQMMLMFGFGILFFAIVIRRRGAYFRDAFALRTASAKTLLIWTLIFFVCMISLEVLYSWGCGVFGIKLKPQAIAGLFTSKSLSGFQFAFVYVAGSFAIPVMEELIFRGIVYQSLKTMMRPWIAIAISSAVFASMHMSLSFFMPLFVMGAIFAYSFEKTKSIYVPICLHCCNNAVMLAVIIIMH
ncbi:MAG: hypothetical protein A2X48_05885 [Lentisphaerae bacterium GWF2_49_21]|nr:MAG: hypothetical protein A2X48_05885 [Lentisphaerae bacterium GWF2_49_21]